MIKKSEINRKDDGSFEIKITIAAKVISDKYQEIIKKQSKNISIKGFRKGQAPQESVEKEIGKKKLEQILTQELVNQAYSEVVKNNNLRPIVPPKIILNSVKKGKDWEITIISCELPEADITGLREEIGKVNAKSKIWTPEKAKGNKDKKENKTRDEQLREVIGVIIKKVKVSLPPILIEHEINRRLVDLVDQLQKTGLKIDQYLASKGINIEQLKTQYQKEVESEWKIELTLGKFADQGKIIVSDQEIEKVIKSSKKSSHKISPYLVSRILRRNKTLEYLLSL